VQSKGRTFRQLLQDEPYLFTGGIYSPLDAQIAESAGMKSIYLSGYSLAMLNGWPDMGLLTMTEVTKAASMVASAVDVPIIADADDGYGNALSTMRTVQEFVKTGVAGIHIEDQRFPKRCGHIAGKTIVSREEALGKYRAALAERDAAGHVCASLERPRRDHDDVEHQVADDGDAGSARSPASNATSHARRIAGRSSRATARLRACPRSAPLSGAPGG